MKYLTCSFTNIRRISLLRLSILGGVEFKLSNRAKYLEVIVRMHSLKENVRKSI